MTNTETPAKTYRNERLLVALLCALYTVVFSVSLTLNSWYLLMGPMIVIVMVAFLWPLVTNLPAPTRSTMVIGLAGMLTLFSFLQPHWPVYLMFVIAFAFIGSFIIQMTRPQPRHDLVKSVAFTVLGVFLSICTAGWVLGATVSQTFYLLSLLSTTWAWGAIQVAELLVPRLSLIWRVVSNVVIAAIFGALGAAFMQVLIPGVAVICKSLLATTLYGIIFGLIAAVIQPLIRSIFGSALGVEAFPSDRELLDSVDTNLDVVEESDEDETAEDAGDYGETDGADAGGQDAGEEDDNEYDEEDLEQRAHDIRLLRFSVTPVVAYAVLGICNFVYILADLQLADNLPLRLW